MTTRTPFPKGPASIVPAVIWTGVLILMVPMVLSRSQNVQPGDDINKKRSLAEAQHEIAMLLLEKKEYSKAANEARKIFALNWPQDQEPILLKELLFFSDQFLHRDQAPLGLKILVDSMDVFKSPASLVAIWKERGYLHKALKQTDEALECFRRAQNLEASIKR